MRFTIRTLVLVTILAAMSVWLYTRWEQPPPVLLPTPDSAFEEFADAASSFQKSGDRNDAARRFQQIRNRYSDTEMSRQSAELVTLFEEMHNEDLGWNEPDDPKNLLVSKRIDYLIYHLRNAECYQMEQPGSCSILDASQPNAAHELLKIGKPAVPKLLELLNDRRPIRAVGFWRDFEPSTYTLLRYQDAALQILHRIYQIPAFENRLNAEYHSDESPEIRVRINRHIENLWKNGTLKDAK